MTDSHEAGPDDRAAVQQLEETITGMVRETMGNNGLGVDDDVFDLGATSLSFVRLLAAIHQRYHVMIHPVDLDGVATARRLAAQVHQRASQAVAQRRGV